MIKYFQILKSQNCVEVTGHTLHKNAILRRAELVTGFTLKGDFKKKGLNLLKYTCDCQMSL